MVRVERVYIRKRDKNYIRILGFEKGEAWSTVENNEVSIFIPEDKFEEIKNAEIIDKTSKDRISELEESVNKIEETLKEIMRLLEDRKNRKSPKN